MKSDLFAKAFSEGVKHALKLFKQPKLDRQAMAENADQLRRALEKAQKTKKG